jgi:FkbM family methyltransferase
MVLHAATHDKVRRVIAFEPQTECALAISKSAQLNNLKNVNVIPYAASDKQGIINFASSNRNPTAAAVSLSDEENEFPQLPCVTVDGTVTQYLWLHTIMLIDVEGHEPSVLRDSINLRLRDLGSKGLFFRHNVRMHLPQETSKRSIQKQRL